jgi:hypothetical protein
MLKKKYKLIFYSLPVSKEVKVQKLTLILPRVTLGSYKTFTNVKQI